MFTCTQNSECELHTYMCMYVYAYIHIYTYLRIIHTCSHECSILNVHPETWGSRSVALLILYNCATMETQRREDELIHWSTIRILAVPQCVPRNMGGEEYLIFEKSEFAHSRIRDHFFLSTSTKELEDLILSVETTPLATTRFPMRSTGRLYLFF